MSTTKYRIEEKKAKSGRAVKGFTGRQMAWWKEDERRPTPHHFWAQGVGKSLCEDAEKEQVAAYRLEHPNISKKLLKDKLLGWRSRIRKELFAQQPPEIQTQYRVMSECAEPRTEAEMYVFTFLIIRFVADIAHSEVAIEGSEEMLGHKANEIARKTKAEIMLMMARLTPSGQVTCFM